MHRHPFLISLVMLVALFSCDGIPDPPNPPRLVNDFAGIFTSSQVDSLERVLVDFDNRTTNQICVVSVKTLAGQEVDEFGLKLANKWGIGTEKNQNGVLLLIKPRGRDNDYIDVTIQVGRGLEGAIPDAYAARIIRNIMGPYLTRDEYWTATVKACNELMGLATGEFGEPHSEKSIKNRIANIKHKVSTGVKSFFHEFLIGLLCALGIGVIFWIISLFDKDDDNKKGRRRRKKKDTTIVPPIDPLVDDNVDDNIGHHHDNSGGFDGFGGFGGGGFGGGGASGRF